MRRSSLRALAVAGLLAAAAGPAALAEEPTAVEQPHAGEGHAAVECPGALTEEADAECLEYWETHINWFSWDYRPGPDQRPEHRHMPPPFGFALINFAVFLYILWRLAARPLADFVRTRHTTIRKDLDDASAIHKAAEARLEEFEGKIVRLDDEVTKLLAQVRAEAEAEKARIIAEAEKQAEKLQQEAEAQIQVELRRMQRALKAEAVAAALAAAEQILRTGATADDQRRLGERFAVEIERVAGPSQPLPRS